MAEPEPAPMVAILNSSDDIVMLLRQLLDQEGYRTATAHVPHIKRGQEDLLAFLEQHDPLVIIYDIAPPYEENWNFFRLVQNTEAVKGRRFVLTTTNKRALEEQAGATDAIEILGKPYDLEEVLRAVARTTGARTKRKDRKD